MGGKRLPVIELKRREYIRKNELLLGALLLPATPGSQRKVANGGVGGGVSVTKRRRTAEKKEEEGKKSPRRSSRLAAGTSGAETMLSSLPDDWRDFGEVVLRPSRHLNASSSAEPALRRRQPAASRPEPALNSSRNLSADASLIASYTGKLAPNTGKEVVMNLFSPGARPKFSKMSGVTEWRNAVFLWVNIGGDGGYNNIFSWGEGKKGERQGKELLVTWFAGSRCHRGTPVICRLLQGTQGDDESTLQDYGEKSRGEPPMRVLFCRLPGEPYVCCGYLLLRGFKETSQPLEFLWALKDTQGMKDSAPFKAILRSCGICWEK